MGMIQIRNVPDSVHRRLKARAAEEGLTLSDYLLREVTYLAELPTVAELTERIRQREAVGDLGESTVEMIRRARDAMG